MKMENYEKKYKDLLERARKMRDENCDGCKMCLESLIPELAEPEDERIRKAILSGMNFISGIQGRETFGDIPIHKCIAWLEKQKPIEHFELKAGQWYICHRPFCCRADHLTVKEGEKFMCEIDGVVKGFIIEDPEKYFKESNPPAPYEDEQKPKWSEEDDKNWRGIIDEIEANKSDAPDYDIETYDNFLSWLDNIKQRMEEQQ